MTPSKPTAEPAVTEDDVAAAARDAEFAKQAATDLEEAVRAGDDTVTPEQLRAAKDQGLFAKLRAESVKRKHEKAKEEARQAACRALYAEIDAYDDAIGESLSGLLQAALDARKAFQAAVDQHNQQTSDWRARALQLGVSEYDLSGLPPESDGFLAIPRGSALIRAGRRELFTLNADSYLEGLKHGSDAPLFVESIKTEAVVADQ
jgi:hypothetical protein